MTIKDFGCENELFTQESLHKAEEAREYASFYGIAEPEEIQAA